jgi:chitodextrinase
MPRLNVTHRPKHPNSLRSRLSLLVALTALLVGALTCAAGSAGADRWAPTMPKRLLIADATPTSLTVSWRGSRDNVGVAGYDVYLAGRPTMQTTATTYTIGSLTCSRTYTIGVAAYDAAGNRSRTAWISGSTAACAEQPPPPPPPPAGCALGQYEASYFNNLTLLAPAALTRCENAPLNRHWGEGAPSGINVDNFSARYTGSFDFDAGTYTFSYQHDDGIRVFVDGALVVEKWGRLPSCPCPNTGTFSRSMTAGPHTVKVEFQELVGAADIALSWQSGSSTTTSASSAPAATTSAPTAASARRRAASDRRPGLHGPLRRPVHDAEPRRLGRSRLVRRRAGSQRPVRPGWDLPPRLPPLAGLPRDDGDDAEQEGVYVRLLRVPDALDGGTGLMAGLLAALAGVGEYGVVLDPRLRDRRHGGPGHRAERVLRHRPPRLGRTVRRAPAERQQLAAGVVRARRAVAHVRDVMERESGLLVHRQRAEPLRIDVLGHGQLADVPAAADVDRRLDERHDLTDAGRAPH